MSATVAHAVEVIRRGEMVVVVDDPDRENEGDFVMAAQRVTPAAVNHMITHGRGLLCLPAEGVRLDALGMPDMPSDEEAETAFTVSIDLNEPGSTGISVADRARCIRRVVDPQAGPGHFRRPGHVFPLRARPGGVLTRRGHTEAAVDLARLAGMCPAGVICEILAEDGSLARGPQLAAIAEKHGMPLISVADLVAHRQRLAPVVQRLSAADLPTPFGTFRAVAYAGTGGSEHVALVCGEPTQECSPLVRVHSECLTGDLFASLRCDCGLQLRTVVRRIAEEGAGVLVYLRGHEGRGIGLPAKLAAYGLQDAARDTVQANLDLGLPVDARDYGDAAEILLDLGLPAVRLLTNNPAKADGVRAGGVGVHVVPLRTVPTAHNVRYLRTKHDLLGHDLAGDTHPVTVG
jgi:3,4-dihydroxy 2-butanone 4-phosphate synthase/GTP cyclohydrolase II